MMTEAEAKEKACCGPETRGLITLETKSEWFSDPDAPTMGRRQNISRVTSRTCIGSACMAWRGQETRAFAMKADAEFKRSDRRLKPTDVDIEGYCGLAGKP